MFDKRVRVLQHVATRSRIPTFHGLTILQKRARNLQMILLLQGMTAKEMYEHYSMVQYPLRLTTTSTTCLTKPNPSVESSFTCITIQACFL